VRLTRRHTRAHTFNISRNIAHITAGEIERDELTLSEDEYHSYEPHILDWPLLYANRALGMSQDYPRPPPLPLEQLWVVVVTTGSQPLCAIAFGSPSNRDLV